jgi:predicted dithiol-disulfide oxidoreductase (DUF899 family)
MIGFFFKGGNAMTRFDFASESDGYRQVRAELLAAEMALKDQTERVAALRRALPVGTAMPDYLFREGPMDLSRNDAADFVDVRLADLFADGHDTLIVDHFMYGVGSHLESFGLDEGAPCPMCSMWVDGTVYHRYTIGAGFDAENDRGIDPYSPVWNPFDLTPERRGDWYPGHEYMERALPYHIAALQEGA